MDNTRYDNQSGNQPPDQPPTNTLKVITSAVAISIIIIISLHMIVEHFILGNYVKHRIDKPIDFYAIAHQKE